MNNAGDRRVSQNQKMSKDAPLGIEMKAKSMQSSNKGSKILRTVDTKINHPRYNIRLY